jgi:hypothetical protein
MPRDEFDQGTIGRVLERRRGDPDPDDTVVQPCELRPGCTRLYIHLEAHGRHAIEISTGALALVSRADAS